MGYEFLEHTADVKFRVEEGTLEKLFVSAFEALMETVKGNISILKRAEKEINVDGKDLEGLLYNFLEEFLFLLDSEGFLSGGIKNISIDKKKFRLKAVVFGDKADKYKFANDVKAITYNSMFVKFDKDNKKWLCQVVLDV